jgi:hypothetical protein
MVPRAQLRRTSWVCLLIVNSDHLTDSRPESFVRDIADRHEWIQYHNELVSEEGRSIPYVTLSNNKNETKKLRIWIQGGQHGDEPAGDQGVLALLGKFTAEPHWAVQVLDKIDLTILPRYNADGVQYFQRLKLRPQPGPRYPHAQPNTRYPQPAICLRSAHLRRRPRIHGRRSPRQQIHPRTRPPRLREQEPQYRFRYPRPQ